MSIHKKKHILLIVPLISLLTLIYGAQAEQIDSRTQEVDWLAGPGGRIKSVRYFKEKPETTESYSPFRLFSVVTEEEQVSPNTIISPPVAGFVPRIAVTVTDARSDEFDWVAHTRMSVSGSYLTDCPEMDFAIGLFDTGASTHLISYGASNRAGIFSSDLVTSHLIEIGGAIHSVTAGVSQPLGIFIDGLASIDPNTMMLNDANMVGQTNVSVIVGNVPGPNQPDLPTAIGSPMSVNFVTAIFNDNPISVTYDGMNYSSPDIKFYNHFDPEIPEYNGIVPLELIPAGAPDVQYFPDLESILFDLIFEPGIPSNIGSLLQSLFFISSVDLYQGTKGSIDKDRFMLDTGAQITVINSQIAARLGFNPADPDFEVEIIDVTGIATYKPGFYVESLVIPALGEWLEFTNVPVVLIDIASPEGGYLDGIIGMNLFTEFNLVIRGGGLIGQSPPSLEFERIGARLSADIAPDGGDGMVDALDFKVLFDAWLATPDSPRWNPKANLAPIYDPDSIIDFLDFAVLAEQWLQTTEQ